MKSQLQGKKRPDETGARDNLMRAGAKLFAEKGYAAASVREIVAKAGVSKPVLYYHFKNKEGLFLHILEHADLLQESMLDRVNRASGPVMDRLVSLCRETYRSVKENLDTFKLIHNLVLGPPQGAPEVDLDRYHRRMLGVIEGIYLEALERGEVLAADAGEVAFIVLGLIDFCFHLDHVKPEAQDPERPERLLRLAFQGLLTNSEKGERET